MDTLINLNNDKKIRVTAWTTETSGLLIVLNTKNRRALAYSLTHERTGNMLAYTRTIKQAQELAAKLASVTDWTQAQPIQGELAITANRIVKEFVADTI